MALHTAARQVNHRVICHVGLYADDVYRKVVRADARHPGALPTGTKIETELRRRTGVAAFEAQRMARLARNILMSAINVNLQMQGVVGRRWVRNVTMFQPQINGQTSVQVVGARIQFAVEFVETSPQVVGTTLDEVGYTLKRAGDGQVILLADFTGLETP